MNAHLPNADFELSTGDMIPTVGTILGGSYIIVRSLAEGGRGDVYVAAHERLTRQVAIKILRPGLAERARVVARLRREAEIMCALRHPHVLQILGFDVTEQGIPFLVMELLEGRALTQAAVNGKLSEPRAVVYIIDQIARALDAAHALEIVHLDLKPDNVILIATDGRDDFVKVIDFGISQASWLERLANERLVAGNPEFMAPEQAGGMTNEVSHLTDQYALAAISYWLLTGHAPFAGPGAEALLRQVVTETPPPPSQWVPGLGAGLDAAIARGMSKRSIDRYPDVLTFANELRGAVDVIAVDRRRVSRAKSKPVV